jgi:Scavenger mRNA decapping enzyme C-term binding
MQSVGEALLLQEDGQAPATTQPGAPQLRFGFHKPPFRSVDHLHMHCFVLPFKWHRWVQYQSSINWVTADALVDMLVRMPSPRPK